MEHPLVSNLNDLTEEQLLEKVTELQRKLSIAYRTGNADLCNQIRMAIESFQTKYQDKIRRDDKNNFDEIINIS
jgi:N-acetyl-anhydromuramyl-L-alanine amidase AmpD